MNKTNILKTDTAIILECVRQTKLGAFWDGLALGGHFWRLYHHNISGAGIVVRRHRIPLKPDKIYLVPPIVDDVRTFCKGEPVQLYIHFELPCLSVQFSSGVMELPLSPLLKMQLEQLSDSLRKDPLAQSPRTNLLATAFAGTAVSVLSETDQPGMRMDPRVANICERFRQSLHRQWSIADLAKRAGMAPNAFLRLFRENTGLPPHQYLLRLRYTRAALILETTSLSIEEICDEIGVHDRFHFSRLFRKFHGISPAAYRRIRTEH